MIFLLGKRASYLPTLVFAQVKQKLQKRYQLYLQNEHPLS